MSYQVGPALLFSQMEPPPERTAEFHDWYDGDHIPARMELSGFTGARRYRAVAGDPAHLAVYELESLAALETPGYRSVKSSPSALTRDMLSSVNGFTRFTLRQVQDAGDRVAGRFLSVVAFAVPPQDEDVFNAWYGDEHVPMLLEAHDWLRVRRYEVVDGEGGPWTHFALHELRTAEVMGSPERMRARSGPLRAALADRPWFADSGRWLYERIASVQSSSSQREVSEDVR